MVKELFARADKPGSTPGDAVFCFFVPFFSVWFLFFNTVFPFGLCSFILTADPARIDQYIFYTQSGVSFRKGISRALDLHTGQA